MIPEICLGLVGAGRWGRVLIRTILEIDGIRLSALASRNPRSRALVPADCAVTQDWRALINGTFSADNSLDGLIIAAPPAAHEEIALAAIDAGLPVLVEKPLTLSAEGAELVRDRSEAASLAFMVEHTHLFHPAYRTLKQHLETLGRVPGVKSIKATAGNWGPFRNDVPVLWDWGAHDISMCLDLMKASPGDYTARRLEQRTVDGGCGETISISLGFLGEGTAEIRLSNLVEHRERRLEVTLGDDSLVYDDAAEHKLTVQRGIGAQPAPLSYAPKLPVTVAIEEFADAIRTGQTQPENLNLAVDVVRLLENLEKSMTEI